MKKEKYFGNNNIFGYRKDNGKLIIHEEESKMIKELFETYSRGDIGFNKIAEKFKEKGYVGKKGNAVSSQTLRRIIRNPKYKGYYRTGTVKVIDYKLHKAQKMPKEEWQIFECKENIPAIVSEELWEKCNQILEKKSTSCLNKVENKDVFKNRYTFSGLIFCKDHNKQKQYPSFNRITGNKRSGKTAWACSKYISRGLKECESPIIEETELIEILKVILNKFLSNKEEIIADLLEKYKKYNKAKDIEKEMSKIEDKIKEINNKKDKLLELTIKNYISNEEFYKRNETLNKEIEKLNKEIQNLSQQKENKDTIEEEFKKIKQTLEKQVDIDEIKEDLIKLLVDKIYVSKIDGNRKHIKLEIYLKIGNPISIEQNLNKKEYIVNIQRLNSNNDNCCAIKEKTHQFCNHDIYNSARWKR